jgi:hypothetical protein
MEDKSQVSEETEAKKIDLLSLESAMDLGSQVVVGEENTEPEHQKPLEKSPSEHKDKSAETPSSNAKDKDADLKRSASHTSHKEEKNKQEGHSENSVESHAEVNADVPAEPHHDPHENEEIMSRHSELEAQSKKHEEEDEKMKQKMKHLEEEMQTTKKKLGDVEKERDELKNKVTEKERPKANDPQLQQLKTKEDSLKKEINNMQHKMEALDEENKQLKQDRALVELELTRLRAALRQQHTPHSPPRSRGQQHSSIKNRFDHLTVPTPKPKTSPAKHSPTGTRLIPWTH